MSAEKVMWTTIGALVSALGAAFGFTVLVQTVGTEPNIIDAVLAIVSTVLMILCVFACDLLFRKPRFRTWTGPGGGLPIRIETRLRAVARSSFFEC